MEDRPHYYKNFEIQMTNGMVGLVRNLKTGRRINFVGCSRNLKNVKRQIDTPSSYLHLPVK